MIDPFKITEPTCISFSGGRTSAYMLWRVLQSGGGQLPCQAVVCFANTGKEDEATLRFVQDCSEQWNVPITWLEYTLTFSKFKVVNFETANRTGQPFSDLIFKRSFLPNTIMRFCTSELKILTIERYFKSLGIDEFETMVGIRADEPRRVAKMRDSKLMPLENSGVTQATVQNFWKNNAFDLNLNFSDGVTALGNCDLCFMKPMRQISSMVFDKPDRAVWWANQEKLIGGTFSKDRPSYTQMLKFSKEQCDMFDPNEEAISCFCGD
jgi:3'-phosphoadenosine 5'-phosphosulfate sulfotransferase (PAPS reductase)/FAD synthetase